MGIKDNFSQAVRELWKKDSEPQNTSAAPSKPTELDKYLRQDEDKAGLSGEQSEASARPASAAQSAQSAAAANAAQNLQDMFNDPNILSAPYIPESKPDNAASQPQSASDSQGEAPNGYGIPDASGVNRNAQNIRENFGQNNANNAYGQSVTNSGYPQSSARPASANFGQGYGSQSYGGQNYGNQSYGGQNYGNQGYGGQGGGGFVPPAQNGAPMQDSSENEEITVISKNTSIDGNIRSLANMQIDGNIKGNLETTRNVELSGKIIGDIVCNNAGMNSAAMQGNVSLKGRMRMDRDTILIGDLSSQYADINGRIRGKLDVAGKAELKRDAIVFGDINASTIAVTDGAIIQGYVNTTFLSKDDSRNVFPETISIDSKE